MHQFTPRSYNTNLISNNHSLIHTHQVELSGYEGITLNFEKIKLPAGSIVEFSDAERKFVKTSTFDVSDRYSITVSGDKVNIKIILSKYPDAAENFSFFLKNVEIVIDPLGIIGDDDERLPYMCYAGTKIGDHSLTAAAMMFGGSGSGSSIGSGNKFMTNWHVLREEENLKHGEVWFNWFNETCDPGSPKNEPVRLETDKLLAIGDGGARDYAIFTVKEFDFKNAHIKTLFGGLKIRETKPDLGEAIYVPQYGDGGLRPMYISAKHEGGATTITTSNDDWVKYNADTQGGSSGSPVIAVRDNEIVALHSTAFGPENGGTSPVLLFKEIGPLLRENNKSLIGEGKVTAFNVEINPFEMATIEVDLGANGEIIPFNTVKLEHFDTYSTAEVEGIDIVSGEIFLSKLKLEAKTESGNTNIGDKQLSGKVVIDISILHNTPASSIKIIRFWLALKVVDNGKTLGNYLTRLTHTTYDPFEIPFEMEGAIQLFLVLEDGKVKTITQKVEGAQYGYIALRAGQGPQSLIYIADGYATVHTMVKDSNAKDHIITLRGKRSTGCSTRPMNVSVGCGDGVNGSSLIIEFYPEDNPHLDLTKSFSGFVPLQATLGGSNSVNILVRIQVRLPGN
jgi:Trypsin-like peptidase domain